MHAGIAKKQVGNAPLKSLRSMTGFRAMLTVLAALLMLSLNGAAGQMIEADYVIVGGGTAGCVLAARLCTGLPNASVVVMERPPPRSPEAVRNYPSCSKITTLFRRGFWRFGVNFGIPRFLSDFDNFKSTPRRRIDVMHAGSRSASNAQFLQPCGGRHARSYRGMAVSAE